VRSSVPASRAAVRVSADVHMASSVVITDGTDSFFGSRTIFQSVHDFGDFEKIIAFGSSTAESKKMLLSRNARYSGLIDVLEFAEGGAAELSAAFGTVNTWLAVNADEADVLEQLKAAQAAGVRRAFVHVSSSESPTLDVAAVEAAMAGGSLAYTLMRTGGLTKTGSGGGLIVSEMDLPTCDEVPIEDVFRFITEAITLPEAEGRAFSLCPTGDSEQLREMRRAGCSRREEVVALLKGQIAVSAGDDAAQEPSAEEAAEIAKSEEEKKAEREEELKTLLARARQRGEETQKKMAEEEAAKAALREERNTYFAATQPIDEDGKGIKEGDGDGDGDGDSDSDGDGDGDGGETKPGSGDDKPKKDGGDDDDDDGLALV